MRPIWNSTRSSRSFCRYATLTRRNVFSPKIACPLKALPMYFPERLVPKRSDMESWNEPPLGPPSFSRLKFRSRAMLFPVVKPCRRPPAGLPRASVANVKVGMIPCSSSQLRTPYRSLNRCWRDRISWNGVSVTVRVPAGTLGTTSWARAPPALQRSARMATATHLREIVTIIPRTRGRLLPLVFRRWCVLAIMVYQYFLSRGKRTRRSSEGRGMLPAASYISPSRVTISSSSASVLVGSIGRVLHDANIHRLINRYTNCLSCFVVDEARRTFKEDIVRVLEDIELAKRLQRVMAAALHLDGKFIAPAPR